MFPKVLKKILWILLWGGLLAFPTLEASAQFDASAILRNQNNQNPNDPNNPNNMLGSNPFQTQNGEEQPAMPTDSTKKNGFESPSNPIFSTIRSVRCPTFRGRSRGTTTRCISIRSIPRSPLSASTTRFIRKASAMPPWVRWDRLRYRTTTSNGLNTATSLLPKVSMSIPIAWKTSPSTTSNGRISTSCTLSRDRRSSGRRISA